MSHVAARLRRPVGGALAAACMLAALTGVARPGPADAQDCGDLSPPPAEPSSLVLGQRRLELDAGESATVPATFAIGRRPQQVDVFFSVDVSESMSDLIDSLSTSIADASLTLARSGIDLQIGLATFSDINQRPYRLVRQVAPVDCGITEDFDLASDSGGREPHLFALHHIVTGEGLATGNRYAVEPGTGAAWRARTRIVVHATDEAYDDTLHNQPTIEQIGREFRAAGVAHTAIQVIDSQTFGPLSPDQEHQDPAATRDDLDATSLATGTLAPPGGIDCTGDGLVTPPDDLGEGDPVVCVFDVFLARNGLPHASAADIAAAMVDALREPIPAEVVVTEAGGLAEATVRDGARSVDVTEASTTMTPSLRLACPPDAAGSTHVVAVAGRFDGETLGSDTLTVTCGQPLAAPPPPPPAPAPEAPPPPAPQPPPPPAPAAPVSAPAPGTGTITVSAPNAATAGATSSAPAQATQIAPGVGVVPDEVREFQVAAELADREGPVLASRRRPSPSPVVVWVAGTMLLGAMSAAEVQRRRQLAAEGRRTHP